MAMRGEENAIASHLGLAIRLYAATAENGRRINEISVDLPVLWPRDFLAAVQRAQPRGVREFFMQELIAAYGAAR